LRQSL
ncbi:hypothetical protein VTH06DRAFT_3987, partial [Thermothelomyces fergusii]